MKADLHLVFGTELHDPQGLDFRDPTKIDNVGIFTNRDDAVKAWRGKAQQTVDNCSMRYFVHPLLTVPFVDIADAVTTAPVQQRVRTAPPITPGWYYGRVERFGEIQPRRVRREYFGERLVLTAKINIDLDLPVGEMEWFGPVLIILEKQP